MPTHPPSPESLAARLLHRSFDELHQTEAKVVTKLSKRQAIARDVNAEFDDQRTLGERVADRVASFGGSWSFIGLAGLFIGGWVVLNGLLVLRQGSTFDPYPYIMLNLVLSMVAALQAPVIMMSQNRQADKDRLDAAHDYEINLKAELEILSLHEKIDALRNEQWVDLVRIQQDQIALLLRLVEANGLSVAPPTTPPAAQNPPHS